MLYRRTSWNCTSRPTYCNFNRWTLRQYLNIQVIVQWFLFPFRNTRWHCHVLFHLRCEPQQWTDSTRYSVTTSEPIRMLFFFLGRRLVANMTSQWYCFVSPYSTWMFTHVFVDQQFRSFVSRAWILHIESFTSLARRCAPFLHGRRLCPWTLMQCVLGVMAGISGIWLGCWQYLTYPYIRIHKELWRWRRPFGPSCLRCTNPSDITYAQANYRQVLPISSIPPSPLHPATYLIPI